jgi:predicted DNA-binding transcriptional regulator AlpA
MTDYLSLTEVAVLAGITTPSMRTYHKRASANREAGNPRPGDLPPEDIRLGKTPGWKPSTITRWLNTRPRKGTQD